MENYPNTGVSEFPALYPSLQYLVLTNDVTLKSVCTLFS